MPPLHRLYIVVANHPDGGARTFHRPQARLLLHLQDNHRKLWPKPSLKDPPTLPDSLQLSKRLFQVYDSEIILWASSPQFPLEIMRNQHLPPNLLSDINKQTYRSTQKLARFLLRRVRLKFEAPAMISTERGVAVDPAAAYLAGTLGRPDTTLLQDPPDYRWRLKV
jgi:hypothetical protein